MIKKRQSLQNCEIFVSNEGKIVAKMNEMKLGVCIGKEKI